MSVRLTRWIVPLALGVLSALLAACGGGGDGGALVPPPLGPPSVTLNGNSIGANADVSQATPAPVVLVASVANAPAAPLHYSVQISGSGVASATFAWQSSSTGQLTVSLAAPASLGAGTYNATVNLLVCTDSACSQPIAGSPAGVFVAYVVTDTAHQGPPSFELSGPSTFQTTTSVTTAQQADFQLDLHHIPPAGLYVKLQQPANGFITDTTYTESDVSDGSVVVDFKATLVSPASLGSGYFSSSVTIQVCLDQACTQQVAGSPVTEPVNYTILLTEGLEYQQHSLVSFGLSDLTYDPVGGKLYTCALINTQTYSGAVLQVDPATGSVSAQMPLGESLNTLAASDDGQFLYVAPLSSPVIHRLKVPSLALDVDIPLGSTGDPNPNNGVNTAHQLAVVPGAAHSVAVALGHASGRSTAGTKIFDDTTERVNSLASLGYNGEPDSLAWSETGALLYAYRYSGQLPYIKEIDQVAVDAAGLTVSKHGPDLTTNLVDPSVQIRYAQGRVYTLGGFVYDAASGAQVGQFVLPYPVTERIISLIPDAANGLGFVLVSGNGYIRLYTYSLTSFALLSIANADITGSNDVPVDVTTNMTLWGTHGVAFNLKGLDILSGSFVAAAQQATSQAHARTLLAPLHVGPGRLH